MLEKFPNYMENVVEEESFSILKGVTKKKKKDNITNKEVVFHFLQSFSSKQLFKLLPKKFLLPSFS